MEKKQMFREKNYYSIFGWMVHKLGLKGTKLTVYAIIYSFSQDGDSQYYGGRKYMADAASSSLPTIDRVLQELEADGYISKSERENDGVSHCRYSVFLDDNGEGIRNDKRCYQNDEGGTYQNDNTHINNKEINNKEKNNNIKPEEKNDLFKEENPEYLFNQWFVDNFPTLSKNKRPLKYKTFLTLQTKYPKADIILKLNEMESKKDFNRKYSDVGRVLWVWLERDNDQSKKQRLTFNKK